MKQEIIIEKEGRQIEMTVWSNPAANRVLIVAPAIGVSRKFYSSISTHFSNEGYNVVMFDYAGVKDGNARLSDWGAKDITRVIDYADESFGGLDIYFLGHSMAGQVLPLARNTEKIKAAFLVASQNPAIDNWSSWLRLKVNFHWHVIIPVSLALYGYLPGFAYGGQNLSGGIAKDWRRWGLSKKGALSVVQEAKSCYDNFNVPVKFISFHDDEFAPLKSVKAIFNSYGSSTKEHKHYAPDELEITGHFTFFRKKYAHTWSIVEDWFNTQDSVKSKVA